MMYINRELHSHPPRCVLRGDRGRIEAEKRKRDDACRRIEEKGADGVFFTMKNVHPALSARNDTLSHVCERAERKGERERNRRGRENDVREPVR